jgi:hypothetical protein
VHLLRRHKNFAFLAKFAGSKDVQKVALKNTIGYFKGFPKGKYSPLVIATRRERAQFWYFCCQKYKRIFLILF